MNDVTRTSPGSPLPHAAAGQNGPVAQVVAPTVGDTSSIIEAPAPQALDTGNVRNHSPVSNPNGAPRIAAPSFSEQSLETTLMVLNSKSAQGKKDTLEEELKTRKKRFTDQTQLGEAKLKEWQANCQSAEAKAKAGGIVGWFKKIALVAAATFSVAMAGIATAATGGAAAPLLALAVLGLASAITGLASDIAKATGHKGFDHVTQWMDPGSLVGKGMGALAKKLGADESQAAIVAAVFSVATTAAILIASVILSGGANAGSAVDTFANSLGNTMKTVVNTTMALSEVAQPVAATVAGLSDMAQGGIHIAVASDERGASIAQADKKGIDAVIVQLQHLMTQGREEFKKLLDEIMDGVTLVSQMINAAAQNHTQIIANQLGSGMSV